MNIGTKVTVVNKGSQYTSYKEWMAKHGSQYMNQWKYDAGIVDDSLEYTIVAKGNHHWNNDMLYLIQSNNQVFVIGSEGIKEAKETMEFKVGDVVMVKALVSSNTTEAPKRTIGKRGTVVDRSGNGRDRSVPVQFEEFNDYWNYRSDELELAVESKTTIDPEDVLRLLLDGKDIRHSTMSQGRYMKFIDGTVKYNDGSYCDVTSWIAKDSGEFEEYIEPPTPPKFSKDSLVYNTDGTIGKVVEDKGLFKGVRKYAVKFNAVRETLKNVDESMLTEYVL